jgi:adhesin/invasin
MALFRRSRALALATSLVGIACGGGGGGGPGPTPTQIAKAPTNAGDNQVGPAGQALAMPVAVVVRDASDNPVAGVTVTWTPGTGSGSLAPLGTSNANGVATATWTLGANAGAQTATASKTGLAGSPVTFNATAQIQGATQMAQSGGESQVGPATQALPTALSIIAKDQNGAAVQGVTIAWSAANGGSVNPVTSATDASGIATTKWTLGPNAGNQTATATKTGLAGSPITFHAVAQVQGATQLAMATVSGNGQTDTVLATLPNPYQVIATDQDGVAVQGVVVDWAATPGGGSVSSGTSNTDVNGIAVITHTLGPTSGGQSAQASVTGLIGSPVTFTASAKAGNAFQIAANSGGGSHTINTSFPYSVIVKDKYGNVKSGATVTWAIQTGSGGSIGPMSTSGADGIATTTRTLGPTTGTYTDTAYAGGLQGSPVLFTVTAVSAPLTATVQVGDPHFFKSVRNASENPAVDTIAVGGTVTWNWVGQISHSVQSTGTQTFTSSAIKMGVGQTYSFTFTTAGTYTYDCAVHGTLMTGRVVVQ